MGVYRIRQEGNMVSLIRTHNGGTPNSVTSGIILVLCCLKISSGSLGQRRRESPLPPRRLVSSQYFINHLRDLIPALASGGRRFIAVGCPTGIFVSPWGAEGKKMIYTAKHT